MPESKTTLSHITFSGGMRGADESFEAYLIEVRPDQIPDHKSIKNAEAYYTVVASSCKWQVPGYFATNKSGQIYAYSLKHRFEKWGKQHSCVLTHEVTLPRQRLCKPRVACSDGNEVYLRYEPAPGELLCGDYYIMTHCMKIADSWTKKTEKCIRTLFETTSTNTTPKEEVTVFQQALVENDRKYTIESATARISTYRSGRVYASSNLVGNTTPLDFPEKSSKVWQLEPSEVYIAKVGFGLPSSSKLEFRTRADDKAFIQELQKYDIKDETYVKKCVAELDRILQVEPLCAKESQEWEELQKARQASYRRNVLEMKRIGLEAYLPRKDE